METLYKIGVAGATPFVLQFLIEFYTNGHSEGVTLRAKMLLSVITGAILGVLIQLYAMSIPIPADALAEVVIPSALGWLFVVLNGGISGAIATAGVNIAYKIVGKIGEGSSEEVVVRGA